MFITVPISRHFGDMLQIITVLLFWFSADKSLYIGNDARQSRAFNVNLIGYVIYRILNFIT